LLVEARDGAQIQGRFLSDERTIDFWSTSNGPLAGSVRVQTGALTYDVLYDYGGSDGGREVVADGYGVALDRETQRALLPAIEALASYLGRNQPDLPLQEQMLYAGLSLLRDSGGMPLERKTFALGPQQGGSDASANEVEKSLNDDGVRCVKRDLWYNVSFDYDETTIIDGEVQAGVFECNGQCGPTCTQLQPWRMWTLDCLEHDSCCNATSTDSCWTPLGECGDEYDAAMGDFLRGFDPFGRHCGG
jgi:hypothetical protein